MLKFSRRPTCSTHAVRTHKHTNTHTFLQCIIIYGVGWMSGANLYKTTRAHANTTHAYAYNLYVHTHRQKTAVRLRLNAAETDAAAAAATTAADAAAVAATQIGRLLFMAGAGAAAVVKGVVGFTFSGTPLLRTAGVKRRHRIGITA